MKLDQLKTWFPNKIFSCCFSSLLRAYQRVFGHVWAVPFWGFAGGDLEAMAGNILNQFACVPQKDNVADSELSLVGMYCRYF